MSFFPDINPASKVGAAQWAKFPAVAAPDMAGFNLSGVNTLTASQVQADTLFATTLLPPLGGTAVQTGALDLQGHNLYNAGQASASTINMQGGNGGMNFMSGAGATVGALMYHGDTLRLALETESELAIFSGAYSVEMGPGMGEMLATSQGGPIIFRRSDPTSGATLTSLTLGTGGDVHVGEYGASKPPSLALTAADGTQASMAYSTGSLFVTAASTILSGPLAAPRISASSMAFDSISSGTLAAYGATAGTSAWSGSNTFNANLPTTTLLPTTATQLTSKAYVDSALLQSFGVNASTGAIALGLSTVGTAQASGAIALGTMAGRTAQGPNAIAVGYNCGATSQASYATACGGYAGSSSQGGNAVAIGAFAGRNNQGTNSVAVGSNAGYISQPPCSVFVGAYAGYSAAAASTSTIVISATGAALNPDKASACYIAPV